LPSAVPVWIGGTSPVPDLQVPLPPPSVPPLVAADVVAAPPLVSLELLLLSSLPQAAASRPRTAASDTTPKSRFL
jgi:hypothetical protein